MTDKEKKLKGVKQGDSKGGDVESKLKSVFQSYVSLTMPGKREVDYEVGFSCLTCFFACVFCLVLLFGSRHRRTSNEF